MKKTVQNIARSYPAPVCRRFRIRFSGSSGVAVGGEEASDTCLRLEGTLEGVLVIVPDETDGDAVGAVDDDDDAWLCWGIVLCCFCGELLADGGAFLGECMDGAGGGLGGGFVTDGGTLEYRVTGGEDIMPLWLPCMDVSIWRGKV